MAFQVRCPSCSKLYAAEERMIGRKMRCKACASVFAIEDPAGEPSLSAASVAGVEYPSVSSSDLTGTRRAEQVPPPPPRDEDEAPMAEEKPFLKPSVPQDFPGALVVEAWLPLGLGLISAVWVISQTFGANDTGQAWVPALRIVVVGLLFLGLVIPLTYGAVRKDFRVMRRVLPPNPGMRTGLTFALPAAFGYEMWQASGGAGGYFMGLILGVALMAAVYWLLFRLNPQEAANSYVKVAGTFLVGCGVSALILIGCNALLNRAMMSEHGGSLFKESPLGEPLAWNFQEPPPPAVVKPRKEVATAPQPEPSAPPPKSFSSGPEVNPGVTRAPEPAPPPVVAVAPETTQQSVVAVPVVNPPKEAKSEVFVNPDEDAFIDSIRKNNFPWVKSVNKGDAPTPFDFTVNSSGQSEFVGLVASDGKMERKVVLEPLNASLPAISDDVAQDDSFGSRFLLAQSGKAIIHLTSTNQLQVLPTGEPRPYFVPMEVPPARVPLKPTLVGEARESSVVIRWAGTGANEQFVYRYDYVNGTKLSRAPINRDGLISPAACAVSSNQTGVVLYAWLSQFPGRSPQVQMLNITSGKQDPRVGIFPPDIPDVSVYGRGEMCFSPDGSKLALLLEQGDSARLIVWPTTDPRLNSATFRLTCKAPSRELVGAVRGPSVRWINNGFLVAYGRTVISTIKHGVVGNLTESPVVSEQTTPDNKLYVTYMLPDSHLHMATVEFDPSALGRAPVEGAGSR